MSRLHNWHRDVFTKRVPTTLVFPEYSTTFGGNFPEVRNDVTLNTARTVVCQRAVNAMSPEDWKHAQEAFDASADGKALVDKDPSVRREHCELWLLHQLHESDHPELVPVSELALQKVLAHHAQPHLVAKHHARLAHFARHGKGKTLTHHERAVPEAAVTQPEVKS
jgi:hypothetical protein